MGTVEKEYYTQQDVLKETQKKMKVKVHESILRKDMSVMKNNLLGIEGKLKLSKKDYLLCVTILREMRYPYLRKHLNLVKSQITWGDVNSHRKRVREYTKKIKDEKIREYIRDFFVDLSLSSNSPILENLQVMMLIEGVQQMLNRLVYENKLRVVKALNADLKELCKSPIDIKEYSLLKDYEYTVNKVVSISEIKALVYERASHKWIGLEDDINRRWKRIIKLFNISKDDFLRNEDLSREDDETKLGENRRVFDERLRDFLVILMEVVDRDFFTGLLSKTKFKELSMSIEKKEEYYNMLKEEAEKIDDVQVKEHAKTIADKITRYRLSVELHNMALYLSEILKIESNYRTLKYILYNSLKTE